MSHRRFVALPTAVVGLLATPPHPAQQMPQRMGMIVDAKLFAHYFGAPLQSPQLGPVPCRLRPL